MIYTFRRGLHVFSDSFLILFCNLKLLKKKSWSGPITIGFIKIDDYNNRNTQSFDMIIWFMFILLYTFHKQIGSQSHQKQHTASCKTRQSLKIYYVQYSHSYRSNNDKYVMSDLIAKTETIPVKNAWWPLENTSVNFIVCHASLYTDNDKFFGADLTAKCESFSAAKKHKASSVFVDINFLFHQCL